VNVSALVAGWSFAIPLVTCALCAERAPLCGTGTERNHRSWILVLERDGITYSVQIDVATTLCGVDGYSVSIFDIHVGDHVEVVQ